MLGVKVGAVDWTLSLCLYFKEKVISKMGTLEDTESAAGKFDDKLHKLIKRAKKQRGNGQPAPKFAVAFVDVQQRA